MGARRRHAVERDPAQERPRAVLQRAPDQDSGVLALQRSAGNRAVADQLQVARDSAAPADTEQKKGGTLSLDGIGSFDIVSYQWGGQSSGGGGGAGGEKGTPTELTITAKQSAMGSAVATVMRAAAEGRKIDKADVVFGSSAIHLHDVYVGSYQTSGGDDPTISFTLNFESVRYGDEDKDKPQGTPDQPRYDLGGLGPAG